MRYNSPEEIDKRFELMKVESVPLSKVMFDTRTVFQEWIRMRDKDNPCISCQKTEAKQWHGGHFYDAEQYPGLIFHPDNVHKQCPHCNAHLKANLIPYRENLIKKIGDVSFSALSLLSDYAKKKVFSKEELLDIKRIYRDKIKTIKNSKK